MNCKRCVLYHPHQETSHLYAIPEISQSIDAYHCTEEYYGRRRYLHWKMTTG
uniref:Uncharacterized protein n=1 Tax=Parascaris univalens TaxID=6257 RepID=A0A915CC86_PARUN